MDWLKSLAKGIASLFQRRHVERELDEELQGYLEASVAHKQRNGMTEEEARRAASVELGSGNSVKHQIWSSRWESTIEGILRDIRLSARSLLKSPGFTATALLSLALGIGGNTAIFTLINQVLLRNLPVRDPQQLVTFGDSIFGGVAGGIDLGDFGGYFPWDFTRQMEANPGPVSGNRRIRQLFKPGEHPDPSRTAAHPVQIRLPCWRLPILCPATISASLALNLSLAAPLCRRTTQRREAERLSC